jgi:hypothetical protein
LLAGVSVEYYVQVERGRLAGVSDDVLHSIARALRLDEIETSHLFHLFRSPSPAKKRSQPSRPRQQKIPAGVQVLIDAMVFAPAVAQNRRLDIVGANALGRALFAPVFEPSRTPNMARFVLLDDRAHRFYPDWSGAADSATAILRVEAGRSPHDRDLSDLVGELSTRSDEFSRRWATHNVREHTRGIKHFNHPVVASLDLRYETLEVPGPEELTVFGYFAAPGSPSEEGLRLLASWAATQEGEQMSTRHPASTPEAEVDPAIRGGRPRAQEEWKS